MGKTWKDTPDFKDGKLSRDRAKAQRKQVKAARKETRRQERSENSVDE